MFSESTKKYKNNKKKIMLISQLLPEILSFEGVVSVPVFGLFQPFWPGPFSEPHKIKSKHHHWTKLDTANACRPESSRTFYQQDGVIFFDFRASQSLQNLQFERRK